jgi:hypothetical protein
MALGCITHLNNQNPKLKKFFTLSQRISVLKFNPLKSSVRLVGILNLVDITLKTDEKLMDLMRRRVGRIL